MSETSAARHGFGIVGAGVIGAVHAEAVGLVPGARLAAVTDVDPGRAKALAAAWDCAAEPDLAALLARDDVGVVAVCVPSGRHAEAGIQAAAAGKHLVVEKPIDVTLAAADRLIAAARANDVGVTVISQHRFDAGLDELRRLLDSGALGRLLLGEASTKWYRTQGYYDSAAWRGTRELDGGSLMNQGIHYLDLLLWAMGPAAEVTAICATQAHRVEVEDTTLALVRFASGAVGTVLSSTAAYPGFDQRLEITGTNGTVIVENGAITRRALAADGGAAAPPAPATSPTAAANPGGIDPASHAAQIAEFLTAIDNGREPAVTAASARATLQVICAVYESARTGRAVAVPAPGQERAR
jgi:UDP-N-acetyl-2-amino-2-deoxyglucuronate dehydrogenase